MISVQTPAAARSAAGLGAQTSIPLDDPAQSHLHLASIWRPERYLELRIKHGDVWSKIFCETPREAALHAQRLKHEADVYVGVLGRTAAGYGGDRLPEYANVIWCEADTELALARVLDHTPRAHITIRSSSGKLHAYWLLNRDIPLEYIVRGNKRLAHHLGCDPASTTKGRILRVAGTRNHKRGDAQRVAITSFNVYPNVAAADLVGHLPDPAPPRPLTAVAAKVRNLGLPTDADTEALRAIPGRQYIPALCGREVYRNMVWCPFCREPEDAPSLSVGGPHDELWICFGCEAAGDIFRFAALTWGLDERRDFTTLKTKLKEVLR